MLQQINLYNLLPKKSRYELSRVMVLSIYGIFLLFLLLASINLYMQKRHVMNEYTQLNKQVAAVKKNYADLVEQYPLKDTLSLKKAIDDLQHQLNVKTKMLNLLTGKNNFSLYLVGLSNVDIPGIWLTEILFNNNNQKINLKGFALQSQLVEKMLPQLEAQTAFSNLKFEIENITETPTPPSFEIQAKEEVAL